MKPTPEQLEEAAQMDVPGDLHSKAEMAAWEALGHGSGLVDSIQMMTIVGTVLRVALEDPRVLGEVTDKELAESVRPKWTLTEAIECVFASRRARLLQSKTVEERVTVEYVSASHEFGWKVFKDRRESGLFRDQETAEIYRLGLIAKMKG